MRRWKSRRDGGTRLSYSSLFGHYWNTHIMLSGLWFHSALSLTPAVHLLLSLPEISTLFKVDEVTSPWLSRDALNNWAKSFVFKVLPKISSSTDVITLHWRCFDVSVAWYWLLCRAIQVYIREAELELVKTDPGYFETTETRSKWQHTNVDAMQWRRIDVMCLLGAVVAFLMAMSQSS